MPWLLRVPDRTATARPRHGFQNYAVHVHTWRTWPLSLPHSQPRPLNKQVGSSKQAHTCRRVQCNLQRTRQEIHVFETLRKVQRWMVPTASPPLKNQYQTRLQDPGRGRRLGTSSGEVNGNALHAIGLCHSNRFIFKNQQQPQPIAQRKDTSVRLHVYQRTMHTHARAVGFQGNRMT